ncbi:MAG: DUF4011 domain-containing protein [Chryseotalea sp. WA131a]|nr:MAG: DUF4011 domain-containing protein [Chryseotalea sp. WA131a]
MASEKTKKLLTNYLRKLTNLSGSNRSIYLPKLLADQHIDLQSLSQLNKQPAFKIIESLLGNKSKIVCAVVDARMEPVNEASKKLKKLQRIDRFIFEERGSTDLHIGWPMVHGKFLDGTCVRCPLLFFPAQLSIEDEQWIIAPREGDIAFNKSFLLAYSHYNQVEADEELLEETFDEVERDSTVFRTAIYQLLQKAKLDIHFNPDNYRDELIPFKNFTRDEFDESHGNGQLKLFPEAVLGIFSQAGSQLLPDYQHLLADESLHDLEDFFQSQRVTKFSQNYLTQVKEDKVYSIFPLDAWQENALKGSKLGYSLVVQGPPGSGKSQLICNLISDAMANGKKVLVVCQKRAALDVVYARMQEQHLADFISLVHDFKTDRKLIFDKIAKQIERVEEYTAKNISLDAIQLNRTFFQCSHRIDQLTEELEQFRQLLFDEAECETSIKQLYLQSNPKSPSINLKQEYQYFKFQSVHDFLRKLSHYCSYAHRFKNQDYPWQNRKSFSNLSASDFPLLQSCLMEVSAYFDQVKKDFQNSFNTELDWEQCEALMEQYPQASTIVGLLDLPTPYIYFQQMISETEDETSSLWLANMERVLMDCFEGEGVEKSIPSSQLGQLQLALEQTRKARKNIFGLIYWELFSKDKFLVKRALVGNGLESTKIGFRSLEKKLDNRLNLEHNISKLKAKAWLHVPESIDKSTYINWFKEVNQALAAKFLFCSIRGIKNLISVPHLDHAEFLKRFAVLFKLIQELPEKRMQWLNYLVPAQISQLTKLPAVKTDLLQSLSTDFDSLIEFDKLIESLSTDERNVFSKLYAESKSWEVSVNEKLFLNSLSIAWIDHIELKHPELRMVSSGKIEMLEQELQEKIDNKQSIAQQIVALRSREAVTENLEFNRLNNRVTYRDLLHQVTKKKKIWPLRKVIGEFHNEVFRLMPCWLASPESVSAIFPMASLFDLVIFDEASQCFAERGIPALYRGKQTVIAGDSRQLRPGDFYMARWDEEGDEPDQEIDSLLELAERYVGNVHLQGHYRSESLALIDFSNRYFYGGKLQLVPNLQTLNKNEKALEFVKVEGVWDKNENLVEAKKVAELVLDLSQSNPSVSIGVITFNAPQQSLVLDEVDELFTSHRQTVPENLFVKNIENVQGDERDIIIFSIGYAPDKKGKVNVQFGSLNQQGGENRLNVAVSRAKKKVMVVCSVWPNQLDVSQTKNDGPKLLKKYLEYVNEVSERILPPRKDVVANSDKLWSTIKRDYQNMAIHLLDQSIPSHDLTVMKNSEYVSAILTDDDHYYKGLSAKALHAQSLQLLEKNNWPYKRLYSRNFWQDRERFMLEVERFLNG